MLPLRAAVRRYPWGSPTAIPDLLGLPVDGEPVAEAWFGAHPGSPSSVGERTLLDVVGDDPERVLGGSLVERFGPRLPFLLKVIAADRPLSLQVHPNLEDARRGFAAEEAAGVPQGSPGRLFPDDNHKPEMVLALTRFEAMAGFRTPTRAAQLLEGLDTRLSRRLRAVLVGEGARPVRAEDRRRVRDALELVLDPATAPSPEEVAELAEACRARLAAGSPSPRADTMVVILADAYPGDPGAVTSLLLNTVTLEPGEALFVPAGTVHAYRSGVGVEIMASSDNVLRAGLTAKHMDIPALLATVDCTATPPARVVPEELGPTRVYRAPVPDFELSVTTVTDAAAGEVPGHGPRVLVCLEGTVELRTAHDGALGLEHGAAAFLTAQDGAVEITGHGTVVQAMVP